jgi:lysyl-tRNA synthetase class I
MNTSVMNFIKVNTTYEVSVNDNKYQLIIPANAPLGEAYDVTFKFLAILAEQAKATAEAVKRQEGDKSQGHESQRPTSAEPTVVTDK